MDWVMDGIYAGVPRGRGEDHAEGALCQASRWSTAETSGSFSDETRSFRWASERNVERGSPSQAGSAWSANRLQSIASAPVSAPGP
jgi:hypothetical protein